MPSPVAPLLLARARRLRFPTLLKLTAALLVADLLLPDPVPFLDELAFGMATLLLANWRVRADVATLPATR
jgi:hypothetical protein